VRFFVEIGDWKLEKFDGAEDVYELQYRGHGHRHTDGQLRDLFRLLTAGAVAEGGPRRELLAAGKLRGRRTV